AGKRRKGGGQGGTRGSPHGSSEQSDLLAALAGEEVDAVHEAHPVAAGAHDERMSAGAVGEIANAAQEVAVRDPGGGDDDLVRRQIVDREDLLDVVDPLLLCALDLAA